mgnify:CR=1 FL=1
MNIKGFRITNKGLAALIAMRENAKQDEETPAHYRIADALAKAGLLVPDGMHWQEADYRPPGYYTLDELTERGPDLGNHVTRARRLTGPWEKA